MNADQPKTRDRILQSAYRLFYREGFSRVSVDAIAEEAQVTKRTVYYHFRSKDDIVAAALEDLHRNLMPQFRSWIGPSSAGPAAMVGSLFARLRAWADQPHWMGSGFTRITAELADLPGHPARRAARSHKTIVETWLSETLAAAGVDGPAALARQIMALIEGGMSLSLIHGDTAYIDAAGAAAVTLATAAGSGTPAPNAPRRRNARGR